MMKHETAGAVERTFFLANNISVSFNTLTHTYNLLEKINRININKACKLSMEY